MQLIQSQFWEKNKSKEDFENELNVLIDFQERGESDLGDKLFNFKKLGALLFDFRTHFNCVQRFCKKNFESGKLRQVEEALFTLESVSESFEEIRAILQQGVDHNNSSRARIETVLAKGSLEFFLSEKHHFELRVLSVAAQVLHQHEFEDLFSFAKIRLNQKLGEPAECLTRFFRTFSKAQQLSTHLNAMLAEGLSPKKSLLQACRVSKAEAELDRRVEAAKLHVHDWNLYLEQLFADCDEVERFFLLMFQGKSLGSLDKSNLVHYLRFFSRDVRLEQFELEDCAWDAGDSKAKIEYLKKLLSRNKAIISQNLHARKSRALLDKNKLNYIRVPEAKTHQFLLYLYGNRFGEQLECSRVFFSTEGATWDSVKCKLRLPLIVDFVERSVLDPNEGIYCVVNVSRLPSSLAKRMLLRYLEHFKKGRTANVLFFLDEHFDNELLKSFEAFFTRRSYDQEHDHKVATAAKEYLCDSLGMLRLAISNGSLHFGSSRQWQNVLHFAGHL